MASKDPYPGSVNQPEAKIIDNPPAKSVAEALANSKAQVDKAK
jgi:hypothetical protein